MDISKGMDMGMDIITGKGVNMDMNMCMGMNLDLDLRLDVCLSRVVAAVLCLLFIYFLMVLGRIAVCV